MDLPDHLIRWRVPSEDDQSLRQALVRLSESGSLIGVTRTVDRHLELAAVLWHLAQGPAVFFEQVLGSSMPAVGNVVNVRSRLASALGITPNEALERLSRSVDEPQLLAEVSPAPCQEDVFEGAAADLRALPIPTLSERDGGPYLTAAVTIVRHPVTLRQNVAISRVRLLGPRELSVNFAPTHNAAVLAAYAELGRAMPIAIVVGSHPAVQVASQIQGPLGFDELGAAGALFAAPLRVARCRTIDVTVPADSEIVIEGTIAPGDVAEEGPFGEFPGTYAEAGRRPRISVHAVTMRRGAVFQVILGARSSEHCITAGLAKEAMLLRTLRTVSPNVTRVLMPEGGTCRFSARVALRSPGPGEAKAVIHAALAAQDLLKHVVVVDDDVDLEDDGEVEWALTTRADYGRDIVIAEGMRGRSIDPVTRDGSITKIGIDATYPPGVAPFTEAGVPDALRRRVAAEWSTYTAR